MRLRLRPKSISAAPAQSKLAPGTNWNGTAGSGFGGNPPVQQTRITAKPTGRLFNVPRTPISSDVNFCVFSRAKGGVSKVVAYCEGNSITINSPTWSTYTDVNGVQKAWYGYQVKFDSAAALAVSTTGVLQVYFEVFPIDSGMQNRLIGPYLFYPRLSSGSGNLTTGASREYDVEIVVDKNLSSNTVGGPYKDLLSALAYLASDTTGKTYKFPIITLNRNGDHVFSGNLAFASGVRETFTTIRAAAGVNATIGDGSSVRNGAVGFDGIRWLGSNLQLDINKISPDGSAFRSASASNNLWWFDGVELMAGSNVFSGLSPLGAGSGTGTLYDGNIAQSSWMSSANTNPLEVYYTDVNAHDIPQYGLSFARLVRSCVLNAVSGSSLENANGLVYGNTIIKCDAVLSGLRTYLPAMTVAYTGAGSNPKISILSNVGALSNFATITSGTGLYPISSGQTVVISGTDCVGNIINTTTVTAPGGGWTNSAALVSSINGAAVPGITASAIGTTAFTLTNNIGGGISIGAGTATTSIITVNGSASPTFPISIGSTIIINGTTVTCSGSTWNTVSDVVAAINSASISDISASIYSGGTASLSGALMIISASSTSIVIGAGSANTALGLAVLTRANFKNPTGRIIQLSLNGSVVYTYPYVMVAVSSAVPRTTPRTTKVSDIVAGINGYANGFSAFKITNGNVDGITEQPRAAMYLSLASQGTASPSPNIPVVSGTASATVGTQLATFIDVHADGMVWHGAGISQRTLFSNVIVAMNRFIRHNASHISFSFDASLNDFSICWNEFSDISFDIYGSSYSGSYLQSMISSHVLIEYCSEAGGNQFFSVNAADPTYYWGHDRSDYTEITRVAWQSFVISTAAAPKSTSALGVTVDNIVVLYDFTGVVISGAIDSIMLASGVLKSDIFTDIATLDNPNFTPKSTYLHLADTTWAGSRDPSGNWNTLPTSPV
jgi:hypothetical protein